MRLSTALIKKGLQDISDNFFIQARCSYWQKVCESALEYIETLEERVAIMTESGEIKYPPEQGELYDSVYWFCGNCNEPIEHGSVEQKHLPDYCRFCGGRIKKGEDDED